MGAFGKIVASVDTADIFWTSLIFKGVMYLLKILMLGTS